MSCWRIGLLVALGAVCAVRAESPPDLAKIDRTIKKEPVYRSKKPLYCLLVFGRDARTRVWLVLDGDVLHVDRNGDGDLTGPGKQITARKQGGGLAFDAGAVTDGKHSHTDLNLLAAPAPLLRGTFADQADYRALVHADPTARLFWLSANVLVPGQKGGEAGGRIKMVTGPSDGQGLLQFADRPAKAPVIHFGGPWRMALFGAASLAPGQETDLVLCFGTPGLGAGTFVHCGYQGLVPESAHPVVDITFPAAKDGKPVRARWVLKERCCTVNLRDSVNVPRQIGTGKAKARLSLAWKEGKVAAADVEIPIVAAKAETLARPVSPLLRTTLSTDGSAVWALTASRDGSLLAAATRMGVVKVWDAHTGEEKVSLKAGQGDIHGLALLDEGKTLVTAHWEMKRRLATIEKMKYWLPLYTGEARLWDLTTRKRKATLRHDPARGIFHVAVSPDGKTLASSDHCTPEPGKMPLHSVSLWTIGASKPRAMVAGLPGLLAFAPDSRTLAIGGDSVRLVDVATAKEVSKLSLEKNPWPLAALAWSRDGRTLAAAGFQGELYFWDAAKKVRLGLEQLGKGQRITALAFSPDSKTLAVAVLPGPPGALPVVTGNEKEQARLELWDVASRKRQMALVAPRGAIAGLIWSRDGKTLAAGAPGGVGLWDMTRRDAPR